MEKEGFPEIFELEEFLIGGAERAEELFIDLVRSAGREARIGEDLVGEGRGRLCAQEGEEAASVD